MGFQCGGWHNARPTATTAADARMGSFNIARNQSAMAPPRLDLKEATIVCKLKYL